MRLIEVEWIDSQRALQEWKLISEMEIRTEKELICRSVGWELHSGKGVLVLVSNLAMVLGKPEDLQGIGGMTIPEQSIRRIRVLKRK